MVFWCGEQVSMTNLPEPSIEHLVAVANELADAAARIVLPYWRVSNLEVESKVEAGRSHGGESPVTIADRAAEEAMRRIIEMRFPEHGIVGEEFGSVRADAEWVWVLDPIDGTKSFITGKPLFGTLIACLHRGSPLVGVIDQCVLKERWVGAMGRPTTLNGSIVSSKGCSKLSEAMMYATTPHMFSEGEETTKYAAMCAAVKRPLYGADCYAYALCSSGWVDLVVEVSVFPSSKHRELRKVWSTGVDLSTRTTQPIEKCPVGCTDGRFCFLISTSISPEIIIIAQLKSRRKKKSCPSLMRKSLAILPDSLSCLP